MTRSLILEIDQISTINLALINWIVRCETEAARMEGFAKEYDGHQDDLAAKARRNVEASLQMKAEAEAVRALIRP